MGNFQAGAGPGGVLSFSRAVFASAADALAVVHTDPNGNGFFAGGADILVLAGVRASSLVLDDFAVR